jgi:two-component system, OmpR family, phosphate regulon sensor histidine kinase PhoR
VVFNARFVSLLIAGIVSLALIFVALFFGDIETFELFILVLSTFFTCYISSYILLEFIVFKEIKNLYSKILNLDNRKLNVQETFQDFNLVKMSNELFNYSEKKNKELKKMKEIETFRRQFLADIAHELKTPVHIAQGFVETLIDGAIDDLEVRDKFLKKTSQSLDNLDFIIRDLINISHLETGEIKLDIKEVDLLVLVQETINQLEEKAALKNIKLVFDYPKNQSVTTKVDRFRIQQVFTNLIGNAINYAGQNTNVWIRIIEKEAKWLVEIEDNGVGISQEHHSKIFNRFYRVDKSRSKEQGGTGLGLAIVKHILEVHGSEIKLQSEVGKGSKFYFLLGV